MKIAAITDDGLTISEHFGRAPYYAVITVDQGEITNHELRNKFGHRDISGHEEHHEPGKPHGFDREAQDRHAQMAASIKDCQILLARGMGMGARYSLEQAGIEVVLTDVADIEDAVTRYLSGDLKDHPERMH
jgi:predicted Fe-Mo cluster-binding NifX family protein